MNDETLIFDPQVLEDAADMIQAYCRRQSETVAAYLSRISALSAAWDDVTFDRMLQVVRGLQAKTEQIMAEISSVYPQHFRDRAAMIRSKDNITV